MPKSRNRRIKVDNSNTTMIQSIVDTEYMGKEPPKVRGRHPNQFVLASSQESAASLRKRPSRQKPSSLLTDEEVGMGQL